MASEHRLLFGVERGDWPLTLIGCSFALACSVGAVLMVGRSDRTPLVSGTEHLNLFAQPAQLHDERLRAQAAVPPPLPDTPKAFVQRPAVDFTPTGSVNTSKASSSAQRQPLPRPAPSLDARPNSVGFLLLNATRDRATFRGPTGEITVAKGGIVPGLGRVTAITMRDGGWTVLLSGAGKRP